MPQPDEDRALNPQPKTCTCPKDGRSAECPIHGHRNLPQPEQKHCGGSGEVETTECGCSMPAAVLDDGTCSGCGAQVVTHQPQQEGEEDWPEKADLIRFEGDAPDELRVMPAILKGLDRHPDGRKFETRRYLPAPTQGEEEANRNRVDAAFDRALDGPHQAPAESQGKVERRWTIWVCPECGQNMDGSYGPGEDDRTHGHFHSNPDPRYAGRANSAVFVHAEQVQVMPVSEHREEVERLKDEIQYLVDLHDQRCDDLERYLKGKWPRYLWEREEERRRADRAEAAIDKVVEELERRAKDRFGSVARERAKAFEQAADLLRKARASKEAPDATR